MPLEATTLEQRIPESDVLPHIEDTSDLVNAVRNGCLVQVRWNDLTEAEKRQAYNSLFSPYELY